MIQHLLECACIHFKVHFQLLFFFCRRVSGSGLPVSHPDGMVLDAKHPHKIIWTPEIPPEGIAAMLFSSMLSNTNVR